MHTELDAFFLFVCFLFLGSSPVWYIKYCRIKPITVLLILISTPAQAKLIHKYRAYLLWTFLLNAKIYERWAWSKTSYDSFGCTNIKQLNTMSYLFFNADLFCQKWQTLYTNILFMAAMGCVTSPVCPNVKICCHTDLQCSYGCTCA